MRLGINAELPHESPEDWAEKLRKRGLSAASFPVDYHAKDSTIDAYVKAAGDYDIRIAEVGVWASPFNTDPQKAQAARERCFRQLELADYVKANCCDNVSGGVGELWFDCYKENFSSETYERNILFIQELCDTVKPKHTFYTLEIMSWMYPYTVEQYVQMLRDVNRKEFGVHLDAANLVKDPYIFTHHNEIIDQAIELLGPHIRSCHLKDLKRLPGVTFKVEETICGTGSVDVLHYCKKIEELDDDMPVLLEHLRTYEEFDQALAYVMPLLQQNGISLK